MDSLSALHYLSPSELRALARSLRSGSLSMSSGNLAVSAILHYQSPDVVEALRGMAVNGFTGQQSGILLDALASVLESKSGGPLHDLVLSGPEVPGVPTSDTGAVMHSLIEQAKEEVLLVGYAIHKGASLFARLAERMAENSKLKVTFCVDIRRPWKDTSLSSEIVKRFAQTFRQKHWPFDLVPAVYFDPRGLEAGTVVSSMHAKCVIIDRRKGLVSSANFTEAAMERNIEVGVLLNDEQTATRVAEYFYGLIAHESLTALRI